MTNVHSVELSTGATLPFRSITAQSGNVYHAILTAKGKSSPYGVAVTSKVVGGSLPTHITFLGVQHPMVQDHTEKGAPRASLGVKGGGVKVTIDGEPRILRLSISQQEGNTFNVKGTLTRPGGASKGARVKNAVSSL